MNTAADRAAWRQSGFALLIVLWTLGLLALLSTQLVAAGRGDAQLARSVADSAMLEAATNGAVQHAIFGMLGSPQQRWAADGSAHVVRLGSAVVVVRLEDEGGKVNPNLASATLLGSLLTQVGVAPATAASLAAAIVDWRSGNPQPNLPGAEVSRYTAAGRNYGPPGEAFQSLDELGLVLGMTPAILARLRPHMTVYTDADPDGSTRDPVVIAALDNPPPPAAEPEPAVASVIAEATGPGHSRFAERIVVRLVAQAPGRLYEILALEHIMSGGANAPTL
jgi:general secretion pathway protein K